MIGRSEAETLFNMRHEVMHAAYLIVCSDRGRGNQQERDKGKVPEHAWILHGPRLEGAAITHSHTGGRGLQIP